MLGIDISNNNGNLDLSNLKNSGLKIVYVKATEGRTFKDSHMENFYEQAKNNGFLVGAYHFLVFTSSPESQAENFWKKIEMYHWDCLPMLDVETMKGFTSSSLCNYTKRFLEHFNSISNGLKIGFYTYTSFMSYLKPIQSYLNNFPLWEANYNGKPFYNLSKFVSNTVGHQYTSTGLCNNFKGDLDEFTEGILIKKYKIGWNYDNNCNYWYSTDGNNYLTYCWKKIGNDWFLFDKEGYLSHGWQSDGGEWYYLWDIHDGNFGKMITNRWVLYKDKYYYFAANGMMLKNSITPDGYTVLNDGSWDGKNKHINK